MIVRSLFILVLSPLAAAGCGPADDAGRAAGTSTEEAPATTAGRPPYPSRDHNAPREAGPRVVFLGTSLTAGLGLRSSDEPFTARLQAMADSAAVPARIVNAGVSGETSAGGLRRITWIVADTIDVLVLELGANDGMRGQDTEALTHNLEAIIDSTRAHWPTAEIVLAGMQAPPNLGTRYTSAFRAVFPTVARERRTVLVPFLLEGVAGVRALNQEDGIHPTSEGHERIARTMWLVLEPVLRRVGARNQR